jgi:hypothetical protein
LLLRPSLTAALGFAVCGLFLAFVPRLATDDPDVRLAYLALGLAVVVLSVPGLLRRRAVVVLDEAGIVDRRLAEPRIPWSLLEIAYYQPRERALRLRFAEGRGHSTEPAGRFAKLPPFSFFNVFAYRGGELCIPLRGLAFDAAELRRALAERTRPLEKDPYLAS